MLQIAENIPTIHYTLLGIGASAYTAFFIYAHPKLTESQKKLNKVLEDAQNLAGSDIDQFSSSPSLEIQEGNDEWNDKFRRLISDAKILFPYSARTDLDINLDSLLEKIDHEAIKSKVYDFEYLISTFFTTYPMTGDLIVRAPIPPSKKHKDVFDSDQYREIANNMCLLINYLNSYHIFLIVLFKTYDQLINQEYQNKIQAYIELHGSHLQAGSNTYAEDIERLTYEAKLINRKPNDQTPKLFDFLKKIELFNNKVMPDLEEAVNEFETYNKKFEIKKITKNSINLAIWIFFLGVVLPLIFYQLVTNMELKYKSYVSYIEYFILFLGFVPYLLIVKFFKKKLGSSIFR